MDKFMPTGLLAFADKTDPNRYVCRRERQLPMRSWSRHDKFPLLLETERTDNDEPQKTEANAENDAPPIAAAN
jgi:hypothetical protein